MTQTRADSSFTWERMQGPPLCLTERTCEPMASGGRATPWLASSMPEGLAPRLPSMMLGTPTLRMPSVRRVMIEGGRTEALRRGSPLRVRWPAIRGPA